MSRVQSCLRDSCPMKIRRILFTADLHINIEVTSDRGLYILGEFGEAVVRDNPDAIVIAGDLSTPSRAASHMAAIRKAVGSRPLAVTLGNHDFWTGNVSEKDFHLLENTITECWEKPCRDNGVVLLDHENARWGEIEIVGGYGHFDLGLAWPKLRLEGKSVTKEIYLAGERWNDFRYIPRCAEFLKVNARAQAVGIAKRLDQAIAAKKRILVATHTCPWPQLNGHPKSGTYRDIFAGYSGNSLVGKEIEKRSTHVEFLMCGHTHYRVDQQLIHGIPSLNVGADYGIFRGVIYDLKTKRIRWI